MKTFNNILASYLLHYALVSGQTALFFIEPSPLRYVMLIASVVIFSAVAYRKQIDKHEKAHSI